MTTENTTSDERTLTDENIGLELFWQKNKGLIFLAVIAAIVLAIAGVVGWIHYETSQAQAAQTLASAKTLEELQTVAKQFAGTRHGDVAAILAAAQLREEGKIAESDATFQSITGRGTAQSLAQFGLAQNAASQGNDAEAEAIYTRLAESKDAFAAPLARLFLARELARSGKFVEARTALQTLQAEFPNSLPATLVPGQLQQISLIDPTVTPTEPEAEKPKLEAGEETPAPAPEAAKPAESTEAAKPTEATE